MEGPLAARRPRRTWPWAVAAAAAVCLAAAALFHLQARTGFVVPDHALDLTRPEGFLLPGSAPVGPSRVGLLRWQARRPLRLRMPGLGPPSRLRLKLLAECPGAAVEVRVDGRPVELLALGTRWELFEIEPEVAGTALALVPVPGGRRCPVHLSAVRTTAVVRRSTDYPRYTVVRAGPGGHPPPPSAAPAVAVAAALLASAAGASALRRVGLGRWLLVVAPGTGVLAAAEALTQAAGQRLVYPPASFPVLLLVPGLLVVAWRRRRAMERRLGPPLAAATRWLRARPVGTLAVLALVTWCAVLPEVAQEDFGGDLRGLVHFGSELEVAERFPGVPSAGRLGYDGQFYALLATDPWLADPGTVERLDAPAHRAGRILVPLLAWTLALGDPGRALWAYMALCWLLALGTVPLVARWLGDAGASPWWAALLLVEAGLAVSMLRVTLDGPALFFLLLALAAHRRDRVAAASLAAAAAALTREVFVLGAVALAAVELRRRRWRRAAALGLPAAAALGLWRLRLAAVTDTTAAPASAIFGLPFRWLPGKLAQLEELRRTQPELFEAEVVALLAVTLAIAAGLRLLPRAGRDPAVLALAAFSCLALFLSGDVYEEVHGYARVLAPLPVLGLGLSGDPTLPRATRWWLRAVALLSAWAGYQVVDLAV